MTADPHPPAPRRAQILRWAQTAVLAAAAVFVFSPAFRGGWLWDDDKEVWRNTALRTARGLREIWFAPKGSDYYPLKDTVLWLQWHLWGGNVPGYHLAGAALHVLGGLLLWRVFRRLGVSLAWLGAMIFVVHPLAVESVAWISELKNTLSLPLLLLSFDAWLDHCGGPSPAGGGRARLFSRHSITALAWFTAAMLCKSSVVMFPCVLLLHAWWRRGRIARADLAAVAPFLAVSLVLGLVTVWFQQVRAIGGEAVAMGGFPSRIAIAGRAAVFYLGKCAWPADLIPVYPRWAVTPPSPVQFLPLPGLGAAVAVLWWKRRSWGRHALFGLGAFLLFLAPVLGFVPMSFFRFSFVADHFAYLPLAALAGLAAAGISAAAALAPRTVRPWAIAALAAAVCAPLAVQGRRHAAIFRGKAVFWTHTLERNPRAWMGHVGLALLREEAGRPGEAAGQYEQALRIEPRSAEVQYNLGVVLEGIPGRMPDAIAHYESAIRLKPDFAEARNNLGLALAGIPGRRAEAAAHYEATIRLKPDYAEPHNNLGILLAGEPGRRAEAIAHYETAIRLKPDYAEAHNNLAALLAAMGRRTEAAVRYEEAIRLKPDYAGAHFNLANLLSGMGRRAEAIVHLEAAVRLKPDFAEAHGRLGDLLREEGRARDAIRQYGEVLRLRPGLPEVRNNLGIALAQDGRLPEAVGQFREALRLKPDYAEAHNDLGIALGRGGRPDEAIREFEEALRIKPGLADAHLNLGAALRASGRIREAEAQFEEAGRLRTVPAGTAH